MTNAKSDFGQTALWRLVATVSSIVTAMIAYALYHKYLGASLFALVLVAVNIVGMLPQFDGGYRLVINRRMLAEGPGPERRQLVDFGQALYSRGALGAGALGMVLLTLYSLGPNARAAGQPLAFYLTLGAIGALTVLGTTQTQLLIGLGFQRYIFVLNALAAWINLGVLWVLFRAGHVLWAFPIAQFTFLTVPTAIAWCLARTELPGVRLVDFRWTPAYQQLFRRLWREAAPAFVSQLVMLFLYAADQVLAFQLLPKADSAVVVFAAFLFTTLRRLLQSADEAIWPRLAAADEGSAQTSATLVRLNAVLYGITMTVAAVTLPTFIALYTPGLEPAPMVIWLFAARYLITGLASQPAYYLYGHGRFGEIARHLGREFLVAVILSFVLAPRYGAVGVAGSFALAALFGVAVPLPYAYAKAAGLRPVQHFVAVWSRALPAMAVSGLVASVLMRWVESWPMAIAAGAGATAISFGLFTAFAAWRTNRDGGIDVRAIASHF